MAEQDPMELGALWEKTGSNGAYMTGEISGVKVVVFRNTRAENNPKAPQWRVLKSKPRDAVQAEPLTADSVPF
jgi:hypothetical protein